MENVNALESFWNDLDTFLDETDYSLAEEFSLFGNDVGGNFKKNVLIKIRKLFNSYEKFVAIYLMKCKKIDNIQKRVVETNKRLLGAVGRYDKWLEEGAKRADRKDKRSVKGTKKAKKEAKQISKLTKDT
jgi:predicted SpoU family rRNA methylase